MTSDVVTQSNGSSVSRQPEHAEGFVAGALRIADPPKWASINDHAGYAQVFQSSKLTFGLVAPLEPYPDALAELVEHVLPEFAN